MRFTVHGFSQKEAIKLKLDNDDLLLIRWFVDFKDTGKMDRIIINNIPFYWISYQSVCDDLPIIATKKDTLYRRLKEIVKNNVLQHETVRTKRGTYSYYALGVEYVKLIDDAQKDDASSNLDGVGKKSEWGTEKNPSGVRKKIRSKDPSTKKTFLQNKTTTAKKKDEEVKAVVDENSLFIKNKIESAIGAKLEPDKFMKMLSAAGPENIEHYLDNWDKFDAVEKSNVAGFFITAVMKAWPIPVKTEKKKSEYKTSHANFPQREYTDEQYESCYKTF
jgi:hypothetical protein